MNEQKKTNYLDEVLTGKLHHLPMGEKESKQKKNRVYFNRTW